MLHTFASRPRHAHPLWLILARLVLALVVGFILALFAGYIVLLILAMTVQGW